MRRTCLHAENMHRMIQIRNVPNDIHRRLKVRAAEAGMSLSEFLLREVTRVARRPTLDELTERIRRREKPTGAIDSAAAVRAERDSRQ